MFTSKLLSASLLSLALAACGGGGGSPTASTPTVTTPTPVTTDYSCDPVAALAAAPKTSTFVNQPELLSPGTVLPVITYERWALTVDGAPNELNVAIMRPVPGVPIIGINMHNHGNSPDQGTKPFSQAVDVYWMQRMALRGYISVAVARRGNFGSSGNMYVNQTTVPLLSGSQIPFFKYQSASIIAAIDKMAGDPLYKPYMSTILVDGSSGGSDTVMQFASDSTTFKNASKKAIIRMEGGVLPPAQVSSTTISALNEYGATIGKSGVPSLWVVGDQDQLSSPGAVACQFKFFNQSTVAAGYANTLYVVPGMGHEGPAMLFYPALRQVFREYMASRGFEGFN